MTFVTFVDPDERPQWEEYSVKNQGYVEAEKEYAGTPDLQTFPIMPFIFKLGPNQSIVPYTDPLDPEFNFHAVLWQLVPVLEGLQFANFEAWQDPVIARGVKAMIRQRSSVMSEPFTTFTYDANATLNPYPEVYYFAPIYNGFGNGTDVVGYMNTYGEVRLFDSILSDQGLNGIMAVVSNPCSGAYTWKINGPDSIYVGQGELVEPDFVKYRVVANATALRTVPECPMTISVYPSEEYRAQFHSSDPAIFTAATILIFVITAMFFVMYDCLVERRQRTVQDTAKKSGAIVDSLFPAGIRERLMENEEEKKNLPGGQAGRKMKKLGLDVFETKPIADYYPEATVLVADIANFSAWSSVREPSQVFTLLETLYNSFDLIAKKKRIFKVESMADCYVACCNVPDPRPDHAVAVARFAKECREKMADVVQKLEVFLGPDTSDLRMRFAINTGPVTAGVLRGDKARFQLFGTTMDICFRLEGSGQRDEIHVAETTANLIKDRGLESWLTPREDKIFLKGKGETQTYWLDYGKTSRSSSIAIGETASGDSEKLIMRKRSAMQSERLVDWIVDILGDLLKEIIAVRKASRSAKIDSLNVSLHPTSLSTAEPDATVLDEVKEIINVRTEEVPDINRVDPRSIELDPHVVDQLKDYVSTVQSLYRPNAFHNFEHGTHFTVLLLIIFG